MTGTMSRSCTEMSGAGTGMSGGAGLARPLYGVSIRPLVRARPPDDQRAITR